MYQNYHKWILLACCFFLAACSEEKEDHSEGHSNASGDMVISENLATPESVLYDQNRDIYLVSNINGQPSETDNNGYIATINPGDNFKIQRWISGGKNKVILNAPKGMAISNGVLWVADIDTLRRFYSATGRPLGKPITIEGATFLNDVCAAENGSVVVSDSGFNADLSPSESDAIYQVFPDGRIKTLAKTPDLKHPNGVFCESDGSVLAVNYHEKDGEITHIARDGTITVLVQLPGTRLDGIEKDSDGNLYVSSWAPGGIYKVKQGENPEVLVTGIDSPADFAIDLNRDLLILPSFTKNTVHLIPLDDGKK